MHMALKDSGLGKDDLIEVSCFVHSCASAKNSGEFHQHILALADYLDFEYVLYGYIHTPYSCRQDAVIVNLTNPKDWMAEYLQNQGNSPLIDEIEGQYAAGKSWGYCVWDRYDWKLSAAQQKYIERRRSFGLEFGCSIFATSETKNFSLNLSLASRTRVPDERTKTIAEVIIQPILIARKRLIMQDRVDSLSAKELEVAKEMMHGKTNGAISLHLGITENTVKYHLKNIYAKMHVNNRQQAIVVMLAAYYLSQ